jgi:hypothetical protein
MTAHEMKHIFLSCCKCLRRYKLFKTVKYECLGNTIESVQTSIFHLFLQANQILNILGISRVIMSPTELKMQPTIQ